MMYCMIMRRIMKVQGVQLVMGANSLMKAVSQRPDACAAHPGLTPRLLQAGSNTTSPTPPPPRCYSVRHDPNTPAAGWPPGQDLTVTATLGPAAAGAPAVSNVTLEYRVNFGQPQTLAMSPTTVAAASGAAPGQTYAATIPGGTFTAGDMVRWRVQVRGGG